MTLEVLGEFGADTEEGLARCMNNEAFYLKMVDMGIMDERFETLEDVLKQNDLETAFEMAHALKGVIGNLALTPLYAPINELTELLRHKKEGDYLALYRDMKEKRDRLLAMQNDAK
ncbi:MAG: Hpt domain-containing protein [Lachnospiraceae bacterium]|nr:Hpt domain-containing protein [Lachnospiraceae bacterium]